MTGTEPPPSRADVDMSLRGQYNDISEIAPPAQAPAPAPAAAPARAPRRVPQAGVTRAALEQEGAWTSVPA